MTSSTSNPQQEPVDARPDTAAQAIDPAVLERRLAELHRREGAR